MQTITTKYHGPTNNRGARISATSSSGIRVSVPYAHELNSEDAHKVAMIALCRKLKWTGKFTSGEQEKGYVFVFVYQGDIFEIRESDLMEVSK